MSPRIARKTLAAVLSATLALNSGLVRADSITTLVPVTPAVVEKSSNLRATGEYFRSTILPKIGKGVKMTGAVGKWGTDVGQLQALIIMNAALAFKASHDHDEMLRLGIADKTDTAPVNTQDSKGACAMKMEGTFAGAFCSGDFMLSVLVSSGMMGSETLAAVIFKKIVGDTKSRLALLTIVMSTASMALTLATATGAAFLWNQAIKIMPDTKMIERANGIAGRAVLAKKNGQFDAFLASEDGVIYKTIMTNMYNILMADSTLRDQWLYNTWRFGLMHGEFIASITTLMATAAAADVTVAYAGARAAPIVGGAVVAWTSPTLALVLSLALGFGAMLAVLSYEAPQKLTAATQNVRQAFDWSQMALIRNSIRAVVEDYNLNVPISYFRNKDPEGWNQNHVETLNNVIQRETYYRDLWVNVAVEKFYELMVEKVALETKIKGAEAFVRNSALQKNLYVEKDGVILSYKEVQDRLCPNRYQYCAEAPLTEQLKALDSYRPVLAQADAALAQLAQSFIDTYNYDFQIVRGRFCNSNYALSPDVAQLFADFGRQSAALRDSFRTVLAGFDDQLAAQMQMSFTPQEKEVFRGISNQEFSIYYTQSFDERAVYGSIQKASLTENSDEHAVPFCGPN